MTGQFAAMVSDFIENSRKKYLPSATLLSPEQKAVMQPFFAPEVLDRARLLVLRGERVQDPPFYGMARMMGVKHLPSFADTAAVTFIDVIVAHEDFSDPLLFHELVHVVQYDQLGSRDFATRYIHGFLQGGSYDEIPLEKNAYLLERRYRDGKSQAFSVADEVKHWVEEGKF